MHRTAADVRPPHGQLPVPFDQIAASYVVNACGGALTIWPFRVVLTGIDTDKSYRRAKTKKHSLAAQLAAERKKNRELRAELQSRRERDARDAEEEGWRAVALVACALAVVVSTAWVARWWGHHRIRQRLNSEHRSRKNHVSTM